jgi:hypothetical protein
VWRGGVRGDWNDVRPDWLARRLCTGISGAASMVLLDGKPIGPAEPWSAKPVGSYDLVIVLPQPMSPATLTISETAGKLGAILFLLEQPHPIPMDVAVNGTDLVLTLNRPEGPITIHLQRRGTNLSGNWTIGADESGTLEGKATL